MNYEFHITPAHNKYIHQLNKTDNFEPFFTGTKILGIDNLDEDGGLIEEIWMTAEKATLKGGYSAALHQLSNFRNSKHWYNKTPLSPSRMKIEMQYIEDFDYNDYLYVETHFQVTSEEAAHIKKGISRNKISGKLIATERCYNPEEFHSFCDKNITKGHKLEFCLFDSNLEEDMRWIRIPKRKFATPMSKKMMEKLHGDYVKLFHANLSRKIYQVS